jgi:undecaprenyl-diphosphatase
MWVVGFVVGLHFGFHCACAVLRFISSHDFTPFAWYRIVFGIVVLLTAHFGWVQWTAH